jgi:hypothetical protein
MSAPDRLSDIGASFPVVLLTGIPEFCKDERSLSKGYIRGRCAAGQRYPPAEGQRFIDQSGNLYVINRAVIKEVGGPAIRTAINVALTWIGVGLRVVINQLDVECVGEIDLDTAKELILPAAENESNDSDLTDLKRIRGARTIPELIAATR